MAEVTNFKIHHKIKLLYWYNLKKKSAGLFFNSKYPHRQTSTTDFDYAHVWEQASTVIPEHVVSLILSCNLERSSLKAVLVGRDTVHLNIWISWCETGVGNFRLDSAAWMPAWQRSSDTFKSLDFLKHLRNLCVCFLLSRVLFLAAAALCLLYSVSTYTKLLWMLLCSNYPSLLLHNLPSLPTGIHLTKI